MQLLWGSHIQAVQVSLVRGKPQPVVFFLTDPISGEKIQLKTLESDPHKFLGYVMTFNNSPQDHLKFLSSLENIDKTKVRAEYKVAICCTHLSYTFSESWVRKDSVGTCPEKFSRWKFSGTERFTKKFHFSLISVSSNKKKVSGSCTHNFDATDLPNS